MHSVQDKTTSLLGFAIKAGKIIFGSDNIVVRGKRKYLVVLCSTLSPKTVLKLKENIKNTPILMCNVVKLEEIVHRSNCKAIALTDKQMADAILKNFDRSKYDLISEDK